MNGDQINLDIMQTAMLYIRKKKEILPQSGGVEDPFLVVYIKGIIGLDIGYL